MKIQATLIFVLTLFSFNAFSQITEGKIIYDVSYPDARLDSSLLASLPFESITYFKDHKIRIDLQSGRGVENRVIVDNAKQEVYVLMDILGDKSYLLMNKKDVEDQAKQQEKLDFKLTDEKKLIAGYNCTKAISSLPDGRNFTIWFTKDIKVRNVNWNNQFNGIDGFLMEFRTLHGTLNMQMTARIVSNEKIDDAVFSIPADYRSLSAEESKRINKGR